MDKFKELEKFIKEYQEKTFEKRLKERNIDKQEIKQFENFNIKAASIDTKNLTLEVIGSKEVPDRHGDIVKINGIDASFWMKNPVVPFAHKYDALPVAMGVGIKFDGDEMIMKLQFTPEDLYDFGYKVFKMFESGFLRAVSIGFIPVKMAWDDELKANIIEKSELLEVSVVPVPANQEALVKAYDIMSKDEEETEEEPEKEEVTEEEVEEVVEETPEEAQTEADNKEILKKYRKFQVTLRAELGIEATEDEAETLKEVVKSTLTYISLVKNAVNKEVNEPVETPQGSDNKLKQEETRPVEAKTSLASRALKMADKL